jgi:hypothetical protein
VVEDPIPTSFMFWEKHTALHANSSNTKDNFFMLRVYIGYLLWEEVSEDMGSE